MDNEQTTGNINNGIDYRKAGFEVLDLLNLRVISSLQAPMCH